MEHGIRIALVVALVSTVVAWARADPSAQAQHAAPIPMRVVVHAGRLLDVKSGRWLLDQNISIEGDKIARVETGVAKTVPGSTK